jgi:hypothetical protein
MSEMSYREKSAWIYLVSTVLVAGFFFLHVPWTLRPETSRALMHGLLYCVLAWLVIQLVAHLIVARLAPDDAKAPKDERERLIELEAIRIARLVYIVATLLAVSMLHIGATGPAVGYGVLFALVLGELVNYSVRIFYHRRGV